MQWRQDVIDEQEGRLAARCEALQDDWITANCRWDDQIKFEQALQEIEQQNRDFAVDEQQFEFEQPFEQQYSGDDEPESDATLPLSDGEGRLIIDVTTPPVRTSSPRQQSEGHTPSPVTRVDTSPPQNWGVVPHGKAVPTPEKAVPTPEEAVPTPEPTLEKAVPTPEKAVPTPEPTPEKAVPTPEKAEPTPEKPTPKKPARLSTVKVNWKPKAKVTVSTDTVTTPTKKFRLKRV